MKKILLILLFGLCVIFSKSQTINNVYNLDLNNDQTIDKVIEINPGQHVLLIHFYNQITAGTQTYNASPTSNGDYCIALYNPLSNSFTWSSHLSTPTGNLETNDLEVYSIQGNSITTPFISICGSFTSVLNLSSSFGGPATTLTSTGGKDAFFATYNILGNILDTKTYGFLGDDEFTSIAYSQTLGIENVVCGGNSQGSSPTGVSSGGCIVNYVLGLNGFFFFNDLVFGINAGNTIVTDIVDVHGPASLNDACYIVVGNFHDNVSFSNPAIGNLIYNAAGGSNAFCLMVSAPNGGTMEITKSYTFSPNLLIQLKDASTSVYAGAYDEFELGLIGSTLDNSISGFLGGTYTPTILGSSDLKTFVATYKIRKFLANQFTAPHANVTHVELISESFEYINGSSGWSDGKFIAGNLEMWQVGNMNMDKLFYFGGETNSAQIGCTNQSMSGKGMCLFQGSISHDIDNINCLNLVQARRLKSVMYSSTGTSLLAVENDPELFVSGYELSANGVDGAVLDMDCCSEPSGLENSEIHGKEDFDEAVGISAIKNTNQSIVAGNFSDAISFKTNVIPGLISFTTNTAGAVYIGQVMNENDFLFAQRFECDNNVDKIEVLDISEVVDDKVVFVGKFKGSITLGNTYTSVNNTFDGFALMYDIITKNVIYFTHLESTEESKINAISYNGTDAFFAASFKGTLISPSVTSNGGFDACFGIIDGSGSLGHIKTIGSIGADGAFRVSCNAQNVVYGFQLDYNNSNTLTFSSGETITKSGSGDEAALYSMTAGGTTNFIHSIGSSSNTQLRAISLISTGELICTGDATSFLPSKLKISNGSEYNLVTAHNNLFILKLGSNGHSIFGNTYNLGSNIDVIPADISVLPGGNSAAIVGSFSKSFSCNGIQITKLFPIQNDVFVIKINCIDGKVVCGKSLGRYANDSGNGVCHRKDGKFTIVGGCYQGFEDGNALIENPFFPTGQKYLGYHDGFITTFKCCEN